MMEYMGKVLESIAGTCEDEILNLDKNISILVLFEIGYHLTKANKKYSEAASK